MAICSDTVKFGFLISGYSQQRSINKRIKTGGQETGKSFLVPRKECVGTTRERVIIAPEEECENITEERSTVPREECENTTGNMALADKVRILSHSTGPGKNTRVPGYPPGDVLIRVRIHLSGYPSTISANKSSAF